MVFAIFCDILSAMVLILGQFTKKVTELRGGEPEGVEGAIAPPLYKVEG